jgi:cystathionine beta-lyase/cystathionine gamma-synthase
MAMEIARYKAEVEALEPKIKPIYTEEPVNPELQTGDSRMLGGAMEIHHPAFRKNEEME